MSDWRTGSGYGNADMFWLYNRYLTVRLQMHYPMTDAEIDKLLDELDKHRGESPAWRRKP